MKMTPSKFIDALSRIQLDNVFNPYHDRCNIYDRVDAPRRRRDNLYTALEVGVKKEIESIWIARDLGYRGGRRTGLPLTDEVHLEDFSRSFGGIPILRATKGPVMAERTAAIIWRVLNDISGPVFLWNIFPLHPYESGDPLSNRCHTRSERKKCQNLLFALLEMLNPINIVAIGRDAQHALHELGLEHYSVRHPSYGGQAEFISGIEEIYQSSCSNKMNRAVL